jgi:hypothetical protein
MKLTKKYALTGIAGGTMGTASYKYVMGTAFVYTLNGFQITKRVFNKNGVDFLVEGNSIDKSDMLRLETLDLDYINTINEERRLLELNEILKSDLSRVIRIMKENEKGFKHFMNYFKNENGLNKSNSFLSTVKSFYKPQFTFSHDTNAIIKVMIKYGYEFKSRKEIVDLIYK